MTEITTRFYWAKVELPNGRAFIAPFPTEAIARQWMSWIVAYSTDVKESNMAMPDRYTVELTVGEGSMW